MADVEGHDPDVLDRLRHMKGVSGVTTERGTVSVTSPDAAAALSAVATELEHSRFRVRSIVLRTPTLDDVFMEMTGSRIEVEEVGG